MVPFFDIGCTFSAKYVDVHGLNSSLINKKERIFSKEGNTTLSKIATFSLPECFVCNFLTDSISPLILDQAKHVIDYGLNLSTVPYCILNGMISSLGGGGDDGH